jgi:hypothetical protein
MKKLFLILALFSAFAFEAPAQERYSLNYFIKHVGKKTTLCGTVASFKLFSDTLTMLNMGGKYPHQDFTVVVTGNEISLNLDKIIGKQICVTGDQSVYLGKPEILIYHPDQLVFKE